MRAEGSPALVSGDMSVGSKQYTDIGLALMHESAKYSSSRAENFAKYCITGRAFDINQNQQVRSD
jgi:hypothetical protein